MKSKTSISLAALMASLSAAVVPSIASADFIKYDVTDPYRGFYIGGRYGYTNHDEACGRNAIKCDDEDEGAGGFIGYDFNRNVALEVSYNELGGVRAYYPNIHDPIDGEVDTTDISLKFSHSLRPQTRLFAKVGGAYWDAKVTSPGFRTTDDGWRPTAGAGIEFPFSSRWAGRLEYQYIDDIGSNKVGHFDTHYVNFGIVYNFSSRAPKVIEREKPAPVVAPAPQKITIDENLNGPLFAFDSAELRNTGAVEPVLRILRDQPNTTVRIAGHTDSVGTNVYNQGLSERRAAAVARYLTANGIASSRISTLGFGEEQPVADNTIVSGRAQNRRVEFEITGVATVR
jgi:OOP family OmpA-OmpF porin